MGAGLRILPGGPSNVQSLGTAEYLWFDREGQIISKTRVIPVVKDTDGNAVPLIDWWSTHILTDWCAPHPRRTEEDIQIEGEPLLLLLPAYYVPNPLRPQPSYIVLCEVRDIQDKVVAWNYRASLRKANLHTWWLGISTPYTTEAEPYIEDHLRACIDAGLMIHSVSECGFKIGPRQLDETVDLDPPIPLIVCDHVVIATWLLGRIAIGHDCRVTALAGQTRRYYLSDQTAARKIKHPELLRLAAPNRQPSVLIMETDADVDPYQTTLQFVSKQEGWDE